MKGPFKRTENDGWARTATPTIFQNTNSNSIFFLNNCSFHWLPLELHEVYIYSKRNFERINHGETLCSERRLSVRFFQRRRGSSSLNPCSDADSRVTAHESRRAPGVPTAADLPAPHRRGGESTTTTRAPPRPVSAATWGRDRDGLR